MSESSPPQRKRDWVAEQFATWALRTFFIGLSGLVILIVTPLKDTALAVINSPAQMDQQFNSLSTLIKENKTGITANGVAIGKNAGQVTENKEQIESLTDIAGQLRESVQVVSNAITQDTRPAWRFSVPDTRISDGFVGGRVKVAAAGFKLRECGVPKVDLYFKDDEDSFHRFVGSQFLQDGRGIAFPVEPNVLRRITYSAFIPDNQLVEAGRAEGFISITYPTKCPQLAAQVAGPLQFRIEEQTQ